MTQAANAKTAVVLVNLGSPTSPSVGDVRRFLREFLSDRRVVNLPYWLWWLILNLFVLPFRPRRSAHAYQTIWTAKGSPLVFHTEQLAKNMAWRFRDIDIAVSPAMRYGKHLALRQQLRACRHAEIDHIVVLPLYPQYSSTTTASIFDIVADEMQRWRYVPRLSFISDYHSHPLYIDALAQTVRNFWHESGRKQYLLMSFHGLPAKLTELGDPYAQQCATTARLLAKALHLKDDEWRLVYQSRFGRAEWLKPYCIETLQTLAKQGVRSIDMICPGFAADCLETLEEIAIANQELFLAAGGESYRYIPALNAQEWHVDALIDLIPA
jgi:protoporphyrin/coproporphyrin ferrochelatase